MTWLDTTSLLGARFGALTVIERDAGRGNPKDTWWRVRCDCGVEFAALAPRLRRGATTHCGCLGGPGNRTRRDTTLGLAEDNTAGHPRGRARNPLDDPRVLPALRGGAREVEAARIGRTIQEVDKVPRGKLE